MSEKDKLQELLGKLYDIRLQQLLTIENIAKGNKTIIDELKERDKELKKAQEELGICPLKEIKRWQAIVKTIEARKSLLDGRKMAMKECRLALTYLLKMEGKLRAEMVEFE